MAKPKWGYKDTRLTLQLGAVFVAFGALFGLLRGDGILLGAVAGLLLFGFMLGVGSLANLFNRS